MRLELTDKEAHLLLRAATLGLRGSHQLADQVEEVRESLTIKLDALAAEILAELRQ